MIFAEISSYFLFIDFYQQLLTMLLMYIFIYVPHILKAKCVKENSIYVCELENEIFLQ